MPKRKKPAIPMAIVAADVAAETVRKPRLYWMSAPPTECDICHRKIDGTFIDGATTRGPWANMDPGCHNIFGRGLGVGRGQKYEKQGDGKWLKVGG